MERKESAAVKLARMEEREKAMADDIKAILTQTTNTNGRVTKLEAWKNRIVGAILVIGAIIGWVVTIIS